MEPATPIRPPTPAWLKVFATFTGNLYLLLGSIVFGLLSILVSPIPPHGNSVFVMARLWANLLLKASCLRVRVRREVDLDPEASYVLLSNHQSLFDIPVLLATVPGQVRMMAKRSLFRIPIFGWGLTAGGFIPIDRGDRTKGRQSFATALARIKSGTSLLLFPESTRAMTDVLLPFQRGGFLIAMKTGLPIVPVGIRGTRAVQHKGSWAIRPGPVEVRYGTPIDISAYGVRRKKELIAEVRARIAELAGLDVGSDTEAPE
jgi:1-acyl-sn-glycerol-3-phosphate acyltransferase